MAVHSSTRAAIRSALGGALAAAGLHAIHWQPNTDKGGRAQKHQAYSIERIDWSLVEVTGNQGARDIGVWTVAISFWVKVTQEADGGRSDVDVLTETTRKAIYAAIHGSQHENMPDCELDGELWRQDMTWSINHAWLAKT